VAAVLRILVAFAAAVLAFASPSCTAAATPAIRIEGSSIIVTEDSGRELSSRQLVGAKLTVATTSGTARLRIDAVDAMQTPLGPLLLHQFSIERDGAWQPYCQADADGGRGAFPIAGRSMPGGGFDNTVSGVEIACTSGALGKCLLLGYLPWAQAPERPMLQLFRACLRMIRADYCGDGRSWTRTGVVIDVFDIFGVHGPDPATTMPLEAAWSPQGADCVEHMRVPELGSLAELAHACPRLESTIGQPCDKTSAFLFDRSAQH
jgi:hypothetical protein